MIKNDRQYRITKTQIERFEQALTELVNSNQNEQLNPILYDVQVDALQSQLQDLRTQLEEYEDLKSGRRQMIELNSFEELPMAIIQARIASGLSQRELAERLGLKEQQIQRYEATEYSSASVERLKEVIIALGLKIQENVFLPNAQISLRILLRRLKEIGIDSDLVTKRLISPTLLEILEEGTDNDKYGAILKVASIIERVFNWKPSDLFNTAPLQLDIATVGSTRFKKPTNANERRASAYTIYAHYLALLVLEATPDLPMKPIPTKASEVRDAIISIYGSISFKNMLNYVWSLGIPVLPLNDPGAFHGACWRIEGRNIIVLKQQTMSEARWLFDFLHELRHAGQDPDQNEFAVIESKAIGKERRPAQEEIIASRFAGDVLLDGRSEELAEKCVLASGNSVERLKAVVPEIAIHENISTEALANYMAFRLSLQGLDWWGSAYNLQTLSTTHWQTARDIFLEHINIENLNKTDRDLLLLALSNLEV